MDADAKDEKVGYGRPPRATRFKPGQSGNPVGRRKGERNVATALAADLKARIVVRENGRDHKLSKAEAIAKALVLRALKGDAKAFSQIMALLPDQFRTPDVAPSNSEPSETERDILERFVTRKLYERGSAPHPESSPVSKVENHDR
jgi:hypothetical protein